MITDITNDIMKKFLDKAVNQATSLKVADLLTSKYNKKELAEELGISRPTLDSRMSGKTTWKKLEIKWINVLSK